MTDAPGRGIKFRESMSRPLLITFLVAAGTALGLIVWLLINPPAPEAIDVGSRRSAPAGVLAHDVELVDLVEVPATIPEFTAPCPAVQGVVVEGGEAAQNRLAFVMRRYLCEIAREAQPPEVNRAIRALQKAKIRFAIFERTGEQSTVDLAASRILLNVDLARTSVDPTLIAPLLIHEAWHLAAGGAVTAAQEYAARVAELQACRKVFTPETEVSRGCLDAQAIVAMGEMRAIEMLIGAGYPR